MAPSSAARAIGEIWASEESYSNFVSLCDEAGGRFCGTNGERVAADLVAGKLADYGLSEVHLEPVEYLSWERGPASLQLTVPRRREIGALAFAYAAPTDAEGIDAEMVYIPEATPEAFEAVRDEIEGKAVLTYVGGGVGPACQSTHWADRFGARALVLMANSYGALQPAGSCRWQQASPIPVISISREDGEYLVRVIRKGREATVELSVGGRTAEATSWNVVGEVPGNGNPGEQVVMGAHYDGFDIAQSAIDNASGAATLMEVARVLAGEACSRTLKFVWFAAEELGMIGSTGYVQEHASEMENVAAMITTDWPGSPASYGVQLPFTGLKDHLEASRQGLEAKVSTGLGMYSDHFPFMLQGVPTMWVGGSITGRDLEIYHTVFDTADKVPPRVLKESSMLMVLAALDLGNLEGRPAAHRSAKEIRELLVESGRSRALESEGRWI